MTETYIIVPVFNEDKQVVYATLQKLLTCFKQIVVVNDGGSPFLQDSLAALPVHYLRHEINLGQGAALQSGTEYVLEMGADYIGHFDADGQHDMANLEQMDKYIREQKLDVLLGSRFLKSEHSRLIPLSRKIILKGAVLVNFIFTGLLLTDAYHGLRLLSRQAALRMPLRENRQLHVSEILWLMKRSGLRFREFPASVAYNAYSFIKGQKNVHSLSIFKDLIISRLIK